MPRKRGYIRFEDRLAAALIMLPCVPQEVRDEARRRKIPAKAVISFFEMDHNQLHAFGGSDLWWNLTPMIKHEHREKSRGDTTKAAKAKEIERKHNEHKQVMAAKLLAIEPPKEKPRKQWGKRKIQSRGFSNAKKTTR